MYTMIGMSTFSSRLRFWDQFPNWPELVLIYCSPSIYRDTSYNLRMAIKDEASDIVNTLGHKEPSSGE